MADWTTTYAVDNTGEVDVLCRLDGVKRITVKENADSGHQPTADLLQRGRLTGSGQVRIAKGTPAIFTCPSDGGYRSGDKAGTIEASAGSITLQEIQTSRI